MNIGVVNSCILSTKIMSTHDVNNPSFNEINHSIGNSISFSWSKPHLIFYVT